MKRLGDKLMMRKARQSSPWENHEASEVDTSTDNLLSGDIDKIFDSIGGWARNEDAEEAVEKWKKEQMEEQQKLEKARARAKEHYRKCILKLWRDSQFGVIIKPNGEERPWEEFCNMGYHSFFGDTPKEEVFKKVIYSKETKPD